MLSATPPSKGSRRSTRVGRHRGGRPSRGGGETPEPSWRPSDKEARKWIQVMRPPAPGARFLIPTWVPVDELTPEEQTKYGVASKEETPAPSETTRDAIMSPAPEAKAQDESQKPSDAVAAVETVVTESADAEMTIENDAKVEANVEKPVAPQVAAPSTEDVAAPNKSADAEMAAVDTTVDKTELNPLDLLVSTAMGSDNVDVSATADTQMAIEEKPSQQEESGTDTVGVTSETAKEGASESRPAALSPLDISRETSEGIPASDIDSKALESIEGFEEVRPHDPVADVLADTATAPPSRPVSEPAAILMKGPAAPLVGESVMSPVAVPPMSSTALASAPVAPPQEDSSGHFVHSGSDSAPFHTLTPSSSKEMEEEAEPSSAMSEAPVGDEPDSGEPVAKKPRIE